MLLTVAQGQEQEIQSDRLRVTFTKGITQRLIASFHLNYLKLWISYVSIKTLCA